MLDGGELIAESVCMAIQARAKHGEALIQSSGRIDEAEKQLKEALELSNRIASDSLTCLD